MASKLKCVSLFNIPYVASAIIGLSQIARNKSCGQTLIQWDEVPCPGSCQIGQLDLGVSRSDFYFLLYGDSSNQCAYQSLNCDTIASTDVVLESLRRRIWEQNMYSAESHYRELPLTWQH